ncbi:MarR family winged helix-turn-helix transcriptional regulator [Stappia indica]|uniref:DNA-binding transcriptional regulator, MarR family n=1 Tax=Stappia indica TaxID=538381 RepID=A0A285TQ94_9HYPH|nr:MarR family transcriptional regulator [Stappia indica]MCC4247014.1 MarR family transcriptional regulator [Stappia indica]SOC25458.1 DNA-binding transcriptional regulator, MarR family [Stappia indica]
MSNDFKPLELEGFLPYRLNVLAETVSQSLAGIYRRRYAISVPEWRIMATLGQFGTMTAKDIGAHSHMHKTKVSRAVASLEHRDLLRRTANTRDMRESFLQLTEKGMDAYRKLVPEAHRFIEALIAPIDPAEKQVFNRVLKQLVQRATELSAELDGPDAPAEG